MVNFNVYISESMILKVEDALKLFRRGSYSIIIRCAHEIDRPPELFARPTGGHPGGGRHCSQSSNLPIFQPSNIPIFRQRRAFGTIFQDNYPTS